MDADGSDEGQRTKNQKRRDGHPQITQMSHESETAGPLAEPKPILASPRLASAGGCRELGDLRTETAESNIVAETTILHVCSTEMTGGSERTPGFTHSASSVASVVMSASVLEQPHTTT
jgi:hypothetical protein